MRSILSMLRLNELERAYDLVQLAEDRQKEVFDEMAMTGKYITPRELQDHKNYLEFAYTYVNTAEFKYLPAQAQDLIDKHIKAREDLLAKSATPGAAPALPEGAAPPPPPAGPQGLLDILGGA